MVGSYPNLTGILIRKGNLDTNKYTGTILCKYGDRDWGDNSIRQKTKMISRNPSEVRKEARKISTSFWKKQLC
jgi:hypothetical protein